MANKQYPQPGEKWQHYKGGQYEIVCMCNHTDTNEELVIYRSLSFGGFHARPYSEWHDEVESPFLDPAGRKYTTNRFSRYLRTQI
jgi:hypothetical protein